MKNYKWDKTDGILDNTGKQVLQIVASNCSKKFRNIAGELLVDCLNSYEQKIVRGKK